MKPICALIQGLEGFVNVQLLRVIEGFTFIFRFFGSIKMLIFTFKYLGYLLGDDS